MPTFTWTATTPGSSANWETASDWIFVNNGTTQSPGSFTTSPGNDYLIGSSNQLIVGNIGSGGTASPDIANSITLSDIQGTLLLADGGAALDVATKLSLNSLLNLGTVAGDNSVLAMGGPSGGGTITLTATGRLEGAQGDSIQDVGTTPTEIMGAGTVIAEGGLFQIGTSVQVAAGATMQFQIKSQATLSFADAVSGGTIVFTANSGSGILDVASLSTFDAPIKNLTIAHGANNLAADSSIDFLNVGTNATATLTNVTSNSATLTVFANTGSQAIPILGSFTPGAVFVNYASDNNGGTNVFLTDAPCYAAGTAILAPDGEVAVETIRPGDVVLTAEGDRRVAQTVIWTGIREIELTLHPRPRSVAPIRFRAGSLGPGLPRRDLLLSPDHCLFIDGGLIPAKLLVNGMTIVRDLTVTKVSYHHIELRRHGLLIVEGVEAESYLDTGNRAYFGNGGLAALAHPEFAINHHLRCWQTDACAPLLAEPDRVRPVWQRFASRAEALGFALAPCRTTTDPAPRLLVDGRALHPIVIGRSAEATLRFVLPEHAASVRLVSRDVLLDDARPWLGDPRRLGVAVRSMRVSGPGGVFVLGADHPGLADGWHAAEFGDDGAAWRWTAGDAGLPIEVAGPCVLDVVLGPTISYFVDPDVLTRSLTAA